MSEQAPSTALPRIRLHTMRRVVPPPPAIGGAALVLVGLVQTWTGLDRLGSLSDPASFVWPDGPRPVPAAAAQALLGLLACAAGLSAGSGRRWGLPVGLVIACIGCGLALGGRAVG